MSEHQPVLEDQLVPDDQSETSSIVFDGQEPFDTFKDRVSLLFQEIFTTSNANLTIDRMKGGEFNRVIGVSVASDDTKPVVERFIIRIPRFSGDEAGGLAPLQLLRQQSTITIPEVVHLDRTASNVLDRPYVIMKRLPGSSLWPSYYELTHEARCSIAQSLGKVFAEMHSITSTVAGRIILSASHDESSQGSLMIYPLPVPLRIDEQKTDIMVPHNTGSASMNTFDTICEIIDRQKEKLIAAGEDGLFDLDFFEEWEAIASEMNDQGIFDQDGYCLCHFDLEARNVMSHQGAVTAILDWDDALFAPLFMSCTPPTWIWAGGADYDDDERLAGEVPPTPELRQIKELFEEAAGPTYLRYAYLPQYRLARVLFQFILDGIASREGMEFSRLLRREWDEVRDALELARNGEGFDSLGDQ